MSCEVGATHPTPVRVEEEAGHLPPLTIYSLLMQVMAKEGRPTGPGLGPGTPPSARAQRSCPEAQIHLPRVLASHATPLPSLCLAPSPQPVLPPSRPCLSYPSAFPTMLSGTAYHSKLGPGVGGFLIVLPTQLLLEPGTYTLHSE